MIGQPKQDSPIKKTSITVTWQSRQHTPGKAAWQEVIGIQSLSKGMNKKEL
jgi:hypothetical protein